MKRKKKEDMYNHIPSLSLSVRNEAKIQSNKITSNMDSSKSRILPTHRIPPA